jgi:hypothetical protein
MLDSVVVTDGESQGGNKKWVPIGVGERSSSGSASGPQPALAIPEEPA